MTSVLLIRRFFSLREDLAIGKRERRSPQRHRGHRELSVTSASLWSGFGSFFGCGESRAVSLWSGFGFGFVVASRAVPSVSLW